MQQIDRGIFFETSHIGVTLGGLIFSHGIILIDAPLRSEDARSWRAAIFNQRGGANRLLINLDAHPDRTLGARAMDSTIIAHQKTAQVFRNRPTIFKGQTIETGSAWEAYPDAIGMRWAIPDLTFTQHISLHWGGPEIVLEHHPGPAAGAIWVIIPANKVLFVGDSVVLNEPPFFSVADLSDWAQSLELLLSSYRDYTMISGRGGLVESDDLRLQQRVIRVVAREMERLAKKNAAPEATEGIIREVLNQYDYPLDQKDYYIQRLKYGLSQYYMRHYRPSTTMEPYSFEEEEQ